MPANKTIPSKVVGLYEEDRLDAVLKSAKRDVLKEFEKICPTDMSFQRIKKDIHDIFDRAKLELQN